MSQTLPCRVEGVGETACLAGHHSSPTYAHKHGSMIQAWLRLFPQCSTQLWQQLRADSPMKHVYIFKGAWTRFKRPPLASPQALASGSVSPVQCPVSPGSTSHSLPRDPLLRDVLTSGPLPSPRSSYFSAHTLSWAVPPSQALAKTGCLQMRQQTLSFQNPVIYLDIYPLNRSLDLNK